MKHNYLFVIFIAIISCKNENKILDQSLLFVENNFEKYNNVYYEANDWVNEMIEKRKKTVTSLIYYPNYKMDKLILFNESRTKCISTINISSYPTNKSASADKIKRFQGVKIDGNWLFFMGANLVLPRDYYKYDMYAPLSFEELSYLARKEFLLPFCKIENGQLIENHEAIDKYVRIQKGLKFPEGETDENWIINYQNKTKDTIPQAEIEKAKRKISGLEKPRSYEIKKLSWWDKLKGKKPPLFERDEWKNRDKN